MGHTNTFITEYIHHCAYRSDLPLAFLSMSCKQRGLLACVCLFLLPYVGVHKVVLQ